MEIPCHFFPAWVLEIWSSCCEKRLSHHVGNSWILLGLQLLVPTESAWLNDLHLRVKCFPAWCREWLMSPFWHPAPPPLDWFRNMKRIPVRPRSLRWDISFPPLFLYFWMKNSPSTYCSLRAGTSDFPSRAFICVWQPLHEVVFCENQCKKDLKGTKHFLQYTSFFPYKRGWSRKCMNPLSHFLYIPRLCSTRWLWSLGSALERPPAMSLGLAHPRHFYPAQVLKLQGVSMGYAVWTIRRK